MTVVMDGKPCYCGKQGCLDAYCSASCLSDMTGGKLEQFFTGLKQGEKEFVDENISQDEIQVLSVYMKQEWLKRTIDTWENIKTQYDEADFSQAHLLDTFLKLREAAKDEAKEIEAIYYRSRKKKPYKYSRLIGGNKQNRRRFR